MKCYVCLCEDRLNNIENGYMCNQCLEGYICSVCIRHYTNRFDHCGICRAPLELKRNQEPDRYHPAYVHRYLIFGIFYGLFLNMLGLGIFLVDSLFYMIVLQINHIKCDFTGVLLIYIGFGIKLFIMGFCNTFYTLCFHRSVKVIGAWTIENIIVNIVFYYQFVKKPVCDTYYIILFDYPLFCLVCIGINSLIYFADLKCRREHTQIEIDV